MNVAREVAKQLAIPLSMILVGALIWLDLVGDTAAIAMISVLVIIAAVNLGRISTEIWPR